MSRRAVAWLAWFLAGTSLALGLAGAVFGVLNGYSPIELAREVAVGVIMAVTFPLVGALVASRRPGNSLGWIFCVIGLAEGLVTAGWEYGTYALRTRPGSVPGGPLAIFYGPVAVAAWPLRGPALLDPAGEGPSLPPLVEALAGVAFPLLVVCGILSVLSLVVRFRRSRAVERQQLKWFVYAAAVTLSGVLITEALPIPEGLVLDSLLAVAGLAVVPSVPVAAGVAILRYRLVRDRPDRQPHPGLRRPDRPAGRGVRRRSPWAAPSAEPGRVAAARGRVHPGRGRLFSPARRRVQSAVDRRFNRARYDATRTVETFSARLRDQVELDSLSADLLAVVDHTVQPTKASLWLRPW